MTFARPTLSNPSDDAIVAAFYATRKDASVTLQKHWRAPPTTREPLFQRMARLRLEAEPTTPADAASLAAQARREALDEWRRAQNRENDLRRLCVRIGVSMAVFAAVMLAAFGARYW